SATFSVCFMSWSIFLFLFSLFSSSMFILSARSLFCFIKFSLISFFFVSSFKFCEVDIWFSDWLFLGLFLLVNGIHYLSFLVIFAYLIASYFFIFFYVQIRDCFIRYTSNFNPFSF